MPYIVAVIVLWVVDTFVSASRNVNIKGFSTYILSASIYAFFEFVIATFILVTCLRIFLELRNFNDRTVCKQINKVLNKIIKNRITFFQIRVRS